MTSMEILVQFADVLGSNGVRCGNASLKEYSKKVFIDGLPANIQSAVRTRWGHEQYEILFKMVHCTGTLLEQNR